MQGMGATLSASNAVVAAAFSASLRHQALIVVPLLAVVVLASLARSLTGHESPEPLGRRVLRLGFGLLWIVDGLLQAQTAMPLGMPAQVVTPAAATSPLWVRHLVAGALGIWTRHPVPAASATVWIQIGIGVLLVVAPRGRLSRLAGLASLGWGLVVWVFGEAFGGIFAPGLTWLFGAPGAVVLYAVAGGLLVLPERAWSSPALGRRLLGALGAFLVVMAVLQAWPGRGFWQGETAAHGTRVGVAAMSTAMAGTAQPGALDSAVSGFAGFDAAHGWAVNLVVVAALATVGVALVTGRRRLLGPALGAFTVLCLADWVLVQDLGVLGGVGTDPNSMVPMVLLAVGGYLALTRVPAEVATTVGAPSRLPAAFGLTATAAALSVLLVGAVPMTAAAADPHTDAILSEALNGQPEHLDVPAFPFSLTDQEGRTVSLGSLRGRAVALTFLDPVCTTDCPLIAQQLRQVDLALAAPATTAFVAVVANPVYRARAFVVAFDRQEHLDGLRNWYYLTGSLASLERAWRDYGIQVQTEAAGGMVAHDDTTFIIGPTGRLRAVVGSDPGSAGDTSASLGTLVASELRAVLPT